LNISPSFFKQILIDNGEKSALIFISTLRKEKFFLGEISWLSYRTQFPTWVHVLKEFSEARNIAQLYAHKIQLMIQLIIKMNTYTRLSIRNYRLFPELQIYSLLEKKSTIHNWLIFLKTYCANAIKEITALFLCKCRNTKTPWIFSIF
jgi:hypothetical protein